MRTVMVQFEMLKWFLKLVWEVSVAMNFLIEQNCFYLQLFTYGCWRICHWFLGCEVTGMTDGSIIVALKVHFDEDFSVSPEVNEGVS